jgi:cephalosporin hydroxylase
VLAELRAYAEFVTEGSYLVVLDTVIEDMPPTQEERWGIGNNPKTAVHAFLAECDRFEIDALIHEKLVVTAAPDGYLRCVRDP